MRRSFMTLPQQILLEYEVGWACSTCSGKEKHVQFSVSKPEGIRALPRYRYTREGNFKFDVKNWHGMACTVFIWVTIGKSFGHV
jgi:hypothetical protein